MADNVIKGNFCWNELATSDVNQAKEFYTKLFGWQTDDHDVGGFTYTMFKNGNEEIGGMYQIPSEQAQNMPPNWMSYVFVDDLSATVEKAKSLNAKVLKDITQVGDFGSMAVIQDPTGAVIALWHKS